MADPIPSLTTKGGPEGPPLCRELKRGDYQLVAPCALPHPPVLAVVQVRVTFEPAFVYVKSLPERE
jgi:hypothetical protein